MADDKKPSRFEEIMRRMGQTRQFPIDPAAPLGKAAEQDDTMPPLYSPEWFRWVEGRFLDPNDPPVPERYLKPSSAKKGD